MLGLGALMRHARKAGVKDDELDNALESDSQKLSIIELIVAQQASSSEPDAGRQATEELKGHLQARGYTVVLHREEDPEEHPVIPRIEHAFHSMQCSVQHAMQHVNHDATGDRAQGVV